MKNIRKQLIWLALMMVLSGVPKVWAGMIDTEVLEAAKREENLRLIIYLEYQPTSQVARDIIPLFEPRIKELRTQIMEQHALVAPPKPKFATAQQEREFVKNQPPIPPDIKANIKVLHEQTDRELSEMRWQILEDVRIRIDPQQQAVWQRIQQLGGVPQKRITLVNCISAIMPADKIQHLANSPGVAYVALDHKGGLLCILK